MLSVNRRSWLVVATIFVTLLLVLGASWTSGVFFTPLLKEFGWSRAQTSTLQSAYGVTNGASMLLAGWLLGRIRAQLVMTAGVLIVGAGFVIASYSHGFHRLILAFILIGLGGGTSTLVPGATVIANWFGEKRGIAMGFALSGTTFGGMLLTPVVNSLVTHFGWRVGYRALAIPMLVVLPIIILSFIRTHPYSDAPIAKESGSGETTGLDLSEALLTRSFWLILLAQSAYGLSTGALTLHLMPFLIDTGYSTASAAWIVSLIFGLATLGKITYGRISDRIGCRTALALSLGAAAAGIAAIVVSGSIFALIIFIFVFGFSYAGPLVLIPLLTAESLGIKRFGLFSGLIAVGLTAGGFAGPVIAGYVFDTTRNYRIAFEVFAIAMLIAATSGALCVPLTQDSESPAQLAEQVG